MSDDAVSLALATADDIAALAAFAAKCFRDTYAEYNSAENMRNYIAAHFSPAKLAADIDDDAVDTLLMRRGPALIGYAQIRRTALPACVTAPAALELRRLYLDRSAHGSGLAVELMNSACQLARRRQATHLWLGVWERNERARAFYAKSGFDDVGTIEFKLGDELQCDHVLLLGLAS